MKDKICCKDKMMHPRPNPSSRAAKGSLNNPCNTAGHTLRKDVDYSTYKKRLKKKKKEKGTIPKEFLPGVAFRRLAKYTIVKSETFADNEPGTPNK